MPPIPNAWYESLGQGRYRSTEATIGPWSRDLQHGGPPAALLTRALERLDPQPGARLARLNFEILSPVPVDELTVTAEVVRPGKRVALLGAAAEARGRTVLRATAWRMAAEPGRSPAAGTHEPAPPLPPEQPQRFFVGDQTFPYGESLEWRFAEGSFHELGAATVWSRCRIPLLEGEPLSGVCRLVAMVDSANGISAVLPYTQFSFVPVGLTVALQRTPEGEWVGMQARTTIEPDGVGLTQTRLFDARGVLGASVHTLFVGPR